MTIVAILAVILVIGAVGLAVWAFLEPRLRRSENLEQIEAYGYTGRVKPAEGKQQARKALDSFASSVGNAAARRLRGLREDEIQRELVSAGFYGIGARRFLGYRVL